MTKTRAGIQPAVRPVEFDIPTAEAERFLQEKMNKVIEMEAKATGKQPVYIKITLLSTRMSNVFIPFMIVLPRSVQKSRGGNHNNNTLSIFEDTYEDDDYVTIRKDVFNFLNLYTFSKEDVNGLFTNNCRKALELKATGPQQIKRYAKPKVFQLSGDKKRDRNSPIVCYLDPYRVFKDMVADIDKPNEKYHINIERKKKKIGDSNFMYSVTKITGDSDKKKDGINKEWEREIAKALNIH